MSETNSELTAHVALDEIRGLVDERARYESWLAALESRRGATPDHVYERVRGDYGGRLERVITQLGTHVAPLESAQEALVARQDELTASLSERHDELAEAELRTLVGEYAPDEGERLRREKEEDIQRMDAEREAVVGELTQVRTLLGRSRSEATAAAGTSGAEVEARAADAGDAGGGEDGADERAADEPAAVEPEPARPQTPAYGGPNMGGVGRPTPNIASFAPDTFTEPARPATAAAGSTAAAPQTAGGRNTPAAGEGFEDLRLMVGGLGGSRDVGAPAGDRAATRPDPFTAGSETGASAPAKTLRCQECGTMNFPTEWYCERCGGELAAL
jgi:hypothetical protein